MTLSRLKTLLGGRRSFRRNDSGAVAIEFAFVAPVFFALTFAIIEIGLVFLASNVLENGTQEVARLIRTGQAANWQGTGQPITQDEFRQQLCNQISFMLSCDGSKLYIDVRSFSSFGSAGFPDPIDANGNLNANLNNFQTGQSGSSGTNDIILVRIYYEWQLFTPFFGQYFANMNGNIRLLSSSVAFRNEPY